MALIPLKISVIGKRTHEWTGSLQRVLRECLDAVQVQLSEKEYDNILNLPDRLIAVVQAGLVQVVELEAGRDGVSVALTQDPDAADELDTSMLPLCDLSGPKLQIRIVVEDEPLATALGAGRLTKLSTHRMGISVWSAKAWLEAQAARPSGNSRPPLYKPEVPL